MYTMVGEGSELFMQVNIYLLGDIIGGHSTVPPCGYGPMRSKKKK